MAKKIIALVLIFCLIFPVAALAKGKPADTGEGSKVEKPEKPNKPDKPDKPGKVEKKNEAEEPGEGEEGEEQPEEGKGKKPEKPGEKGRLHAIEVKLAKWSRMPESALKGLWNAILSIGRKIGFVSEKPGEEEPGEEQPGEEEPAPEV